MSISRDALVGKDFVKNCEKAEILLFLQANKLDCSGFLDSGR